MFFKKHKEKILLKLLDMKIQRLCKLLDCEPTDITEYIPDEKDRDVILYQIDKKGINALKKELY